jgi:prepilin-type N-terminal cleavage/methylation domain-containing protein
MTCGRREARGLKLIELMIARSSGFRAPLGARARYARGLTLIELMIAIALMLIMTLQLQLVFGESRKLYLGADAMAQVYSNARSALDVIEKDLANAAKSDQMEFFNDNRAAASGVGHYNKTEENWTVSGQIKTGSTSFPHRYIHSLMAWEPKPYMPVDNLKMGGPYRHDLLYFRTFTDIGGTPREALVYYRLYLGVSDASPRERPVLQRIVTGPKIDKTTGVPMYDGNGNPLYEQLDAQDICYYVQEFAVDLFIGDRRRPGQVGRFYTPQEATSKGALPDEMFPPGLPNLVASSTDFAVECMDGKDDPDPGAIMMRTDGRLHLRNNDRINRTGPGDKMYLISKPDAASGNTAFDFLGAYLTVKRIDAPRTPGGETIVEFQEESDIKRQMPATGGDLTMAYRCGWLPTALRVQMKIKDQRSSEIRTITRIFRLLRA